MTDAEVIMHDVSSDLARVDLEAARSLALVAPVELRVAERQADAMASFRLRYQAVIEQGWMRPEDFPDSMERDDYDVDAVLIVSWLGSQAVGTIRLVLPVPRRRLPTEETFALTVEPQGEVVDWGRIAVSRNYSGPQHQLMVALLAKSWLETRARGYCQVCGTASGAVIRLYRQAANITITPIGPSRLYWGERRYPVLFDFRLRA